MAYSRSKFLKSFSIGNLMEKLVLITVQKKYPEAKLVDTYFKGYDIFVNDKITLEVKYDIGARRSGNAYVEFICDDAPSGVLTTKASHWVFVFQEDCFYTIEYKKLYRLFEKYLIQGRIREAGIDNHSVGVVIPLNELKSVAKVTHFANEGESVREIRGKLQENASSNG